MDNPKTYTIFSFRQNLAGMFVRVLLSFDLLKVKVKQRKTTYNQSGFNETLQSPKDHELTHLKCSIDYVLIYVKTVFQICENYILSMIL